MGALTLFMQDIPTFLSPLSTFFVSLQLPTDS